MIRCPCCHKHHLILCTYGTRAFVRCHACSNVWVLKKWRGKVHGIRQEDVNWNLGHYIACKEDFELQLVENIFEAILQMAELDSAADLIN